ncbi:MAG: hypothetical protein RR652_04310 [Mucinivorans sp.]
MTDLVRRYPYFFLARLLVTPVGELKTELTASPYPTILLYNNQEDQNLNITETTIADESQDNDTEDLAAPYMVLNDGAISETLASIYASQGQKELAREIYLKLSLKNPEKSRYFVSLIEKL